MLGIVANSRSRAEVIVGHRHWALFSMNWPSTRRLAEVQMRITLGGGDVCSGGTASTTTGYNAGTPALVFNNNFSDYIQYTAGNANIRYDFGNGNEKDIVQYTLSSTVTVSGPSSWIFRWSDNGSDWTTVDSRSGISWSGQETKTFTI